jgi:hypothetical protein
VRTPARWLVLAHPNITTVAIVATANHFVLDAVVGAVIVLIALALDPAIVRAGEREVVPLAAPAGR